MVMKDRFEHSSCVRAEGIFEVHDVLFSVSVLECFDKVVLLRVSYKRKISIVILDQAIVLRTLWHSFIPVLFVELDDFL